MLESALFSIGAFLGVLSGALTAYVIVKRQLKTDILMEISEEIFTEMLEKLTNDAEMQKKVYLLGALLGNGIKSGLGIQKTGGKFKMEDLFTTALQAFLGGKLNLGGIIGQGQPQTSNTEMV